MKKAVNLYQIPHDTLRDIFEEALSVSYRSWTDRLVSDSLQRQESDLSLDEAMRMAFDTSCLKLRHITIIERVPIFGDDHHHFEFGLHFHTEGETYRRFVWILVSLPQAEKIFEKHSITII